jgi:hypothetical protein
VAPVQALVTRSASNVWRLGGVFLLAAATRLAYFLAVRPPVESAYWALSGSLLQHASLAIDGVRDTEFEPLYPVFLALSRLAARDSVFAVQLAQIAVASVGAVCLYRLAEALAGRPRVALVAALLYAGYPLLVRQAALPSDLALMSTLLVAFSLAFVRATTAPRAAVAGVWLGLAVLTRAMALPLIPLSAGVLAADRRPRAAVALALAAVVVVCPFPIRNHAVNGSWWPTRSGLNLYIGNSPYTAALLPDHDLDILQPYAQSVVAREVAGLSSAADPDGDRTVDALLTRRALTRMAEHPLRTLGEKVRNAMYFLSPVIVPLRVATPETRVVIGPAGEISVEGDLPRPAAEVAAHAVSWSVVLLCALAGVYLRRHALRRDAVLWCIVATVVAVHAMYFPASRYTAPMVFVFMFYAAVALDDWRDRVSRAWLPRDRP